MKYQTTAIESREWRYKDKSNWAEGPWQDEPDKAQWTDPKTGLPCLLVRQGQGSLCGYVGVPKGHPLFGVGYSDLDEELEVHGGITYTSLCEPHEDNPELGVCHVVEGGEKVWWWGFDAGHAGDRTPDPRRRDAVDNMVSGIFDMIDSWPMGDGGYRDLAYMTGEVTDLAEQLNDR